jgi:hypothetical protein
MIKIEKNIPIQPRYSHSEVCAALAKMKPGDSFSVKTPEERHSILNMAIRSGHDVITRKMKDGTGYRIWRV